MSENLILALISAIGCMILAVAGFSSYRVSMGDTMKMALIWVGIFALGFVVARLLGLELS